MKVITAFCLAAVCSCAVVHPPGWAARQEPPIVIGQTSGGWELPDGRVIRLNTDTYRVGFAATSADIEFSAAYNNPNSMSIRCQTDPDIDGFPETRFGCWGEQLEFWMAPVRECRVGLGTRLASDCWHGELTNAGRSISFIHGYMESSDIPVGYISWAADGEPLLAANIVAENRIRVYEVGADLSDDLRDRLELLTVALAFYWHATDPN